MFTVDEDDRYDVTFHMKEKRWFGGGMHATFGGENNATMVKVYALSILWIKKELSIYTGLLIHITDHLPYIKPMIQQLKVIIKIHFVESKRTHHYYRV